ncbi:TPA: hypothetical protein ACGAPA_001454 [Legionella pneumophila]|uniref:hypothetical protein n=1 Tax=Legionella septentrionalis TaxID=2498109 RepID=UPI000F8C72D7|nr:hypothetical protein [Legionella septentrionalis]HAT8369672.1 hypothetical protein [Legionella pneumophila]RUR15625.1 hypothetical protein ELY10_05370 [Legionella septentrionalis]HCC0378741.1 hypothetical protein [Legionella pneumophila]HEJ6634895.1 hypothetical protein [Legionella pneumophila]HEK3834988.1 hypothetical protein [Legionella pneumophila]
MEINDARQSIYEYFEENPIYSGELQEINNDYQIKIIKRSCNEPRQGRYNEDIQIKTQTITRQNFERLTVERLKAVIKEIVDEFNQN